MADKGQRRIGSLGFVLGFAIGIPATIFALSNLESTAVEFLGWEAEVPLWFVIALSLVAGVLIGVGGLLAWQTRRRMGRRRAAKAAAKQAARTPATSSADTPALDSGSGGSGDRPGDARDGETSSSESPPDASAREQST